MDVIALAYCVFVLSGAVAAGGWLGRVAYRLSVPPVIEARQEMRALLRSNAIRVQATEGDTVFEVVEEDTPAMKEAGCQFFLCSDSNFVSSPFKPVHRAGFWHSQTHASFPDRNSIN